MKIVDRGFVFDATNAAPNQHSCSFPSVVALSDGRVLVCFRGGSSKDAADENLIIRESADHGRTWATIFQGFDGTLDGTPGSWRHGPIAELRPGELIGCFCWFDRSDPSRPLANSQTQGTLPSRIFLTNSLDRGRTWTNRRELIVAPFEGVATTGAVLPLAGGTLALPTEAWKSYYDQRPGKHNALLWLSDDGGQSFKRSVITAHDPSGRFLYWDQRIAVAPDTGNIVALYWTHDRIAGQDANVHVAWCSGCGRDWTGTADTGIAGQIASPVALGNGRLLAAYVHRHYPPTLRAVLSEDFGKSWDVADEEVFYESGAGSESGIGGRRDFGDYWADMNLWNFGHPEAVRLSDGGVFIAFYAGDARALSIHWVRLEV